MNNHKLTSQRRRPRFLLPQPGRSHVQAHAARLEAVQDLLNLGFPYSCTLRAHHSCVNALAFSSGDGRFLASGGDDLAIHLWDLHEQNAGVRTPSSSFHGPRQNIFVLSFSAQNRFLYSGGVDDTVLKYDLTTQVPERLGAAQGHRYPDERFHDHSDSIRAISTHATQDDIFLTGSEDGRIILHDTRLPRPQNTLQLASEVTGLQFHPDAGMAHLFATSDNKGRVCLRDTRMAFGPAIQRAGGGGVVLEWHTRLARRGVGHLAAPETSSLVWNRDGTMLGVTMLHYYPTLYGLEDPDPLAVCTAPPNTYANSCTMKHGSFGGPGLDTDVLYVAGSDDFRAYVWDVPSVEALKVRREVVPYDEWEAGAGGADEAFAQQSTSARYLPAQLSPSSHLGGHASIVNTVVVHPRMMLVATAGIECGVVLHGAGSESGGVGGGPVVEQMGMERTGERTRRVGEAVVWEGEEGEERDAIGFFDELLIAEGQTDVFVARKWRGEDEDDDHMDSEEEEDDDEGQDCSEESEDGDGDSDDEMEVDLY
ncbi:WD40 repeat-like protein [Roridomyces roridus]|uniref:WD40 repeat-like protein n=1 Tax=Roridomyces roridus TaxID=1738132 RepID=A0AAD7CA93_9AGAR|nr:WD40 repeat-like protein [Roridomyces roridus]